MQKLKLYILLFVFVALVNTVYAKQEDVIEYQNGVRYEGEIANGQPHGMGTMKFPSGEIFQGRFTNGLLQGTAVMTKPDGATFIGEYRDHNLVGELRPLSRVPTIQQPPVQTNLSSHSDCLKAYEQDYRLGELIIQINQEYGRRIRDSAMAGLIAYTQGAGNNTTAAGALASGGQASVPHRERTNQLYYERDQKVSELNYQRGVLISQNPNCRLLKGMSQ